MTVDGGSYRAWVLEAPGALRPTLLPVNPLPDAWVRVRVLWCGICGSDLSKVERRRAVDLPMSLGHEFLAETIELGAAVDGLGVGDLVTSDLNHRCGRCDQCVAGRSHLCRTGQVGRFSNRAFAEVVDIHVDELLRIDGPATASAALAEPLSCVLHAMQWAEVRPDDRVLVLGAGGLGLCMAFALVHDAGIGCFTVADPREERRTRLGRAAAPHLIPVESPDGEFDVVFDLSGAESGLRAATLHVVAGGRLCTMSHLDGASADFLLAALTRRDVTFTVSYLNGQRRNLERASSLLAHCWGGAWEDTLEIVDLDEVDAAVAGRSRSGACKTVVRVAPVTAS